MRLNTLLLFVLIVGYSAAPLLGQSQAEQKPEFEVASMKPTADGSASGLRRFSAGRYVTRGATLKELIGGAYGVDGRSLSDRQLAGAPAWLSVD